jgi:hypothetical protein
MKPIVSAAIVCLCLAASAHEQTEPAWRGHAGNAQHTAAAPRKPSKLARILWSTPVDEDPQLTGAALLRHYASPMITGSNTVLVPVKTRNGFRMEARTGATGDEVWREETDFIPARSDWLPSFPAHLTAHNRLYFAGAGGTVYFRDDPDRERGDRGQLAFFGLANYASDPTPYNEHVMIDTPITADEAGNIYFGFVVTGPTPLDLESGIARIGVDGTGAWIAARDLASDDSITGVAQNCAPAVSVDQSTIYVAVSGRSVGYLVALDSATLERTGIARLRDPSSGNDAMLFDISSASPTVGPDGDVYYGVFENPFASHHDRGWLLHFSADLSEQRTPGSFGWDNTVSVVPASGVRSYRGSSPYLLMSKYNNYFGSGRGHHEIAILDPHATQRDRFSDVDVMQEVMTKENPTQVPGEAPGVVHEWCINSAAVDPKGRAVIANAEDGHAYRWDLRTDELTDLALNAPRFEAYTPTLVGSDGTVYVINDATLYAIGRRRVRTNDRR